MLDKVLSLLDQVARQYGKIPSVLPLLEDEWEALYTELAGPHGGGHRSPWLRVTHQSGEVICISRAHLLEPGAYSEAPMPTLALEEPEEREAHPLYPPCDYPRRAARARQDPAFRREYLGTWVLPPPVNFWK